MRPALPVAPGRKNRYKQRVLLTITTIRDFSLGIEALERFVRREPLRRVHECVFGVLAFGERTG